MNTAALTTTRKAARQARNAQVDRIADRFGALYRDRVKLFAEQSKPLFQACKAGCWGPVELRDARKLDELRQIVSGFARDVALIVQDRALAARRLGGAQGFAAAGVVNAVQERVVAREDAYCGDCGMSLREAASHFGDCPRTGPGPQVTPEWPGACAPGEGGGGGGVKAQRSPSSKAKAKEPGAPRPANTSQTDQRERRGHITDPETAVADLVAAGYSKADAKRIIGSVRTYTSSEFTDVNECLAAADCDQGNVKTKSGSVATVVERVDAYLDAAPKYDTGAPLYRGMTLTNEMMGQLKPGATIESPAYSSTTSKENVAVGFMSHSFTATDADYNTHQQVVMVIKSHRSGVSISHLSKHQKEAEVLFPRNRKWRVLGVGRSKNGKYGQIEVEEAA